MAGIQDLTALQFRYTDITRTAAEMTSKNLFGLRIGGGAGYAKGPWWAEADLAFSYLFPPSPMIAFRLQGAYEFTQGLYAHVGFSTEHRWLNLTVPDTEEQIKIWDVVQPFTIGIGGARVATIEHLMAAFHGMKVDNALVAVDGLREDARMALERLPGAKATAALQAALASVSDAEKPAFAHSLRVRGVERLALQ
jgi:hypothetical protein